VNAATLWGVGVFLGMFLTFPCHMGVEGLWIGLASGVAAGGVATSAAVAVTDWEEEAVRAREAALSTNTSKNENKPHHSSPHDALVLQRQVEL
jgi:hypothetical protein